jgi:hypothetical protein
MTKQETLLRIAGMMTILRDDLEEVEFSHKLKQVTNMWLKEANKKMEELTGGGEEANEQLIALVQEMNFRLNFSKKLVELE